MILKIQHGVSVYFSGFIELVLRGSVLRRQYGVLQYRNISNDVTSHLNLMYVVLLLPNVEELSEFQQIVVHPRKH